MSYLNQPYPNNFQELCAAMPLFYMEVLEMRAVLRAQSYLLDCICNGMEKLVDCNFILTADEATIKLWEKALRISYSEILTLEQRKHVVISYIIGFGHIGEPEIRGIIALYTDFDFSLSFEKGNITISIDGLGYVSGFSNLIDAICRRMPAHLSLNFVVTIRSPTQPKLYIGSSIGIQPSISIPQEPDSYYFQNTIHTGGGAEADVSIGVPLEPDICVFREAIRAGGVFSGLASRPFPEGTTPPGSTTILRTGGVCTMVSNLPPTKGD